MSKLAADQERLIAPGSWSVLCFHLCEVVDLVYFHPDGLKQSSGCHMRWDFYFNPDV